MRPEYSPLCVRLDDNNNTGLKDLFNLTQVANEELGREIAKEKKSTKGKDNSRRILHLWEFLLKTLEDEENHKCMEWTNKARGEFRIVNTAMIAQLWGESKSRNNNMTYDKLARAMRYYYKINLFVKVPKKRLHYKFSPEMLARFEKYSWRLSLCYKSRCNNNAMVSNDYDYIEADDDVPMHDSEIEL